VLGKNKFAILVYLCYSTTIKAVATRGGKIKGRASSVSLSGAVLILRIIISFLIIIILKYPYQNQNLQGYRYQRANSADYFHLGFEAD